MTVGAPAVDKVEADASAFWQKMGGPDLEHLIRT
jgi:hypothetical protein